MNRINRYILRHVVIATIIATTTLVFAIWLIQSLRLIEVIVDGAAPVGVFLRLVVFAMPEFLTTVLPLGFVGAVLFTYNRLMADSEMVVMRSAGIGPTALARPALMLAAVVMVITYALNFYIWPRATQEFRQLRATIQSEYASVLLREGQFNTIDDDITVYLRERLRSGELEGILIHDNRDPQGPVTVIAKRGILVVTDSGPRVLMFDGTRQQADPTGTRLDTLYFDQYAIDLEVIEPTLGERWEEPSERYVGDLLNPDRSDPDNLRFSGRLFAEGHTRLTSPLWILAFTLAVLGVLLSGEYHRRGQGRRIIAAILTVVVLQAMALWLQSSTRETPALYPAMYFAPVLVALAGGALMYLRPVAVHRAAIRLRPVIPRPAR